MRERWPFTARYLFWSLIGGVAGLIYLLAAWDIPEPESAALIQISIWVDPLRHPLYGTSFGDLLHYLTVKDGIKEHFVPLVKCHLLAVYIIYSLRHLTDILGRINRNYESILIAIGVPLYFIYMVCWAILVPISGIFIFWMIIYIYIHVGFLSGAINPLISFYSPLIVALAIAAIPRAIVYWRAYFSEHPTFREWFHHGKGASARWAGIHAFRKNNFKRYTKDGSLDSEATYLGETRLQDSLSPIAIGIKNDAHMVTIGMTGAGKSTTVLYNNLPIYQGSKFVLDPKGELACFDKSWKGVVLDPFQITNENNCIHSRYSYNPLAEFDIHSPDASRYLSGISDALVVDDGDKNKHWTDNSRTIVEGVIAHVMSTRPKEEHSLPHIFDILQGMNQDGSFSLNAFEDLLDAMLQNTVAGKLPVMAARVMKDAGDREFGTLMNMVQRAFKWSTHPQMREHLKDSHFTLRSHITPGGTARSSVYVVLPFDYISEKAQGRWMRLLTNMTITVIQTAESKPSPPVLMVLDEFPALGRFEKVEKSMAEVRGAGIKIWIFLQNMGQLKKLYGENWQTFTGNSTVQVLALGNETDTPEWVSDKLGRYRKTKTEGVIHKEITETEKDALLSPAEVKEFLSKGSGNQIVFPVDGLPMRLKAVFYKHFLPARLRGEK